MTEKFIRAITIVLRHEGGYVNNPADPGGETKYGISKRQYPSLDIKNLSVKEAEKIYFEDYWMKYGFEAIPYDGLAAKVFDIGVNVGPQRAIRFMQEGAIELGAQIGIDGRIGPQTIAAVSMFDEESLIERFKENAKSYYLNLDQPRFIGGWLNRLNDEA